MGDGETWAVAGDGEGLGRGVRVGGAIATVRPAVGDAATGEGLVMATAGEAAGVEPDATAGLLPAPGLALDSFSQPTR